MRKLTKILAVFINLANYGVGIAVAIIMLFGADFISVFYLNGMTTNESLFFNMTLFQLGLALVGLVLCLLTGDSKPQELVVEFPLVYGIVPLILGGVSIVYAFFGTGARETVIQIICAVLYIVLSAFIIYSGARVFQIFPKENSK